MSETEKFKPRVYFAGKISKNDWRIQGIQNVDGVRANPVGCGDTMLLIDMEAEWSDVIYCGPFAISCDHGCSHGNGGHGVDVGCEGDSLISGDKPEDRRRGVHQLCMAWIASADFVFAWVDASDAHGTYWELGYAHAIGKPIFVAYPRESLSREVWFPGVARVNTSCVFPDPHSAYNSAKRYIFSLSYPMSHNAFTAGRESRDEEVNQLKVALDLSETHARKREERLSGEVNFLRAIGSGEEGKP